MVEKNKQVLRDALDELDDIQADIECVASYSTWEEECDLNDAGSAITNAMQMLQDIIEKY